MEDYQRAKMLKALGRNPADYCEANKHLLASNAELQPVPGTDHLEPYCRGCEEGLPGV